MGPETDPQTETGTSLTYHDHGPGRPGRHSEHQPDPRLMKRRQVRMPEESQAILLIRLFGTFLFKEDRRFQHMHDQLHLTELAYIIHMYSMLLVDDASQQLPLLTTLNLLRAATATLLAMQ